MHSMVDKYGKDAECRLNYKKKLAEQFVTALKNNKNINTDSRENTSVHTKPRVVKDSTHLIKKIDKLQLELNKERKNKDKYKLRCIKTASELSESKKELLEVNETLCNKDKYIDSLLADIVALELNVSNLRKSCSKLNSDKLKLIDLAEGRARTIRGLNGRVEKLQNETEIATRSLVYTREVNLELNHLTSKVNQLQRDKAKLMNDLDKIKAKYKRKFLSPNRVKEEQVAVAKVTSLVGRFKHRNGVYYFEDLEGVTYSYKHKLPFAFKECGFFGSAIVSSFGYVKHISYLSLDAKSVDEYLRELAPKKGVTILKPANKNLNIKKANIRKIFTNQKILICSSYKVTNIVDYLLKLGLNVKLFDSYAESPNRLNRLVNWADYVINVTGNSKHYVNDIISNHECISDKKYSKVYKLTYSNVMSLLNTLLS